MFENFNLFFCIRCQYCPPPFTSPKFIFLKMIVYRATLNPWEAPIHHSSIFRFEKIRFEFIVIYYELASFYILSYQHPLSPYHVWDMEITARCILFIDDSLIYLFIYFKMYKFIWWQILLPFMFERKKIIFFNVFHQFGKVYLFPLSNSLRGKYFSIPRGLLLTPIPPTPPPPPPSLHFCILHSLKKIYTFFSFETTEVLFF